MSLLIGWAEESIIPEKKASLAGQFFERISEFVESEITVTAMAIESDGDCAIIVSADIISIHDGAVELARHKLSQILDGFDTRKLIVSATHTHTSVRAGLNKKFPDRSKAYGGGAGILDEFLPEDKKYTAKVVPDESVMTDDEGVEFVTDKIALAAKKAWESREKSYYANEFGRAAVGMCRRVSYDDGSAQMWGDTNTANFVSLEGGNDSGVELIYTFDANKKLTGVAANICCPAQILEQRSFISADFWGRARALIREKLGDNVKLLSLCGAAGDQCPRDLVRWVEPETPIDDPNVKRPNVIDRKADPSMYDISGCNKVGKRIANEVVSVFEEITELKDEAIFKHEIVDINLPLRKVTMKEYDHAVRELKYYIDQNKNKEKFDFEDKAYMHVHTGTIARYRLQQTTEIVPIEYHVIRFGDVALTTNPFEMFLDYGNYMKARSMAKQTFVIQLCGGAMGYLPTEKAEKAGHYSANIASGSVGHQGGDLLVRDTLTRINKMFE